MVQTIIMRILGFPLVAVLGLIAAGVHYLNFLYCFARYGGEMVVYDRKTRKTVSDILTVFENMQHETNS